MQHSAAFSVEYWEQRNREAATLTFSAEKLSFRDWLLTRYQISPLVFKIQVLKTGTLKEYRKAMAWYYYRYRKEMAILEQLNNNNPFMEDKKDGFFKQS